MDIIVFCPGRVVTGGTESLHLFASALDKLPDVNAKILYIGGGTEPHPAQFDAYGCDYLTELPDGYAGVVVFPEIWANMVCDPKYRNCTRSVLWLGVDAFFGHNPGNMSVFNDPDVVHLYQSAYARDFLLQQGVTSAMWYGGNVNEEFYKPYEDKPRKNIVLYNPAKADKFTYDIIRACPDVAFMPLSGYTREQLAELMRSCKLYIDFGYFPGRERIPREAALCGCCLLTSKSGTAFYQDDFDFPTWYKFEKTPQNIHGIVKMIHRILNDYEMHRYSFTALRLQLNKDRDEFPQIVEAIAKRYEFQHHNSRI